MTRRIAQIKQGGFTLVELLAVIAIIGILVAILLPTVGAVRNNARNLQCQNNLKQVGAGVQAHGMAKERFPGMFEIVGKEHVTWYGKILAQVGSETQADLLKNGNQTYIQYMAIAVCPSDVPDTTQPYLSYAANGGVWDQGSNKNDTAANGLFHDLRALGAKGYVGQEDIHDGQSQTILLAENVDATVWARPNNGTRVMREGTVGITWPWDANKWIGINTELGKGPLNGDQEQFARPSSRHSGHANVCFADGHVIPMSQDISREVYGQLMSSWGERTSIPWASNAQLNFQLLPLSEDMYTR